MKYKIMLGYLLFVLLALAIACNKNDCPGENTADSPALHPIRVFYFEKNTNNNILGIVSSNYRESDFEILRIRNSDTIKVSNGNFFFSDAHNGQSLFIDDYSRKIDSTFYLIGFLEYTPDTLLYNYNTKDQSLSLVVNGVPVIDHDICEYWEPQDVVFFK